MLFEGLNRNRLRGSGAEFKKWKHHDVNPLSGRTKTRVLHAPNERMLKLHRRFLKNLRRLKVSMPAATSVAGSSPRENVRRHLGHRYFFLTDLSNAFGHVNVEKLAKILAILDKDVSIEEIEDFLKSYCMASEGGLIAGSPSSQDLFNIYCNELIDRQLLEYAQKWDIRYSRYLDDLTFSSNQPIGASKRNYIRKVITSAGFGIGHHKSQVLDLAKAPIEINGVGLSYDGRMYLPRRYLRKIRGLIRIICRTHDHKLMHKLSGMMGLYFAYTDTAKSKSRLEMLLIREYHQIRDDMRRIRRGLAPRIETQVAASVLPQEIDSDLDDLPF